MADKTTSAENAGAAIQMADIFRAVQNALNVKFTFTQVQTWVRSWIAKGDVGLGNVDNTSDVNKPVSTLQAASIATKQALDAQLSSVIPFVQKSVNYTTVLGDGEKCIQHPLADNNARTFTIDSNANVAYPIGTVLTFDNEINTLTIALTTDTLVWAATNGTGSRTLAAGGFASAIKSGATKWKISGSGLT